VQYPELTAAFHLRLGRLADALAQLEFNVGLALRWLPQETSADNALPAGIAKWPLSERVDALDSLLLLPSARAKAALCKACAEWIRQANLARAIRYDYLHARWSFPDAFGDDEIFVLLFPAPEHSPHDRLQCEQKLTLRDFDRDIEEVTRLTRELIRLRNHFMTQHDGLAV
jgi:hypothetical protein